MLDSLYVFPILLLIYLEVMFLSIASASTCNPESPNSRVFPPLLCTAPIKVHLYWFAIYIFFFFWSLYFSFEAERKLQIILLLLQYQYANYSSPGYKNTGKGSLRLQLINQRSDFAFALFSGGLANVCLLMTFFILCFIFEGDNN